MALATNPVDINRKTTGLTLTPEQSQEVLAKAVHESTILQLARRIELPGRGLSIPVVTGEPVADFVAETAEKPVSNSTFETKTMTPYKIAVIELFSNEFRRDYARLYDELVRRLPYALGKKLDTTVFDGTAPGTGFDTLANATDFTLDPTQLYQMLVGAYSHVATAGYTPTAWALSPAGEVQLYGAVGDDGHPIFLPTPADGTIGAVLGAPVVRAPHFNVAGDGETHGGKVGLVGDWNQMRVGIVGDIDLSISEEATINTGTELVNLWQRNMFAVRAEFEVGVIAEEDAFAKLVLLV